jgi:hypothetical protein
MSELKGITVRLKKRIHEAIKLLAMKDGRSVREYTRLLCVGKVKEEVEKGNISNEYLAEEEEVGGTTDEA